MKLDNLLTPFLAVDLDRVEANVAAVLRRIGSAERWRPHLKTTKIPEVWDLLLAAGLRRFKCATLLEAEVLLERAPAPVDLLVAMPLRGPALPAVASLRRRHPGHGLALLTEDPDHAVAVRRLDPAPDLFLDLNPGMDRTGIPLADRARILATAAAAGPALRGVHAYEGHILDRDPGRRRRIAHDSYEQVLGLHRLLQEQVGRPLELSTSGTPCLADALAFAPFDELGPPGHTVGSGTLVFTDGRSRLYGLEEFTPAAWVGSRVISRPAPDLATCDAGSKALDCAVDPPWAAVEGHPELVPVTFSEEHLVLRAADPAAAPDPGDHLRLVPAHVCPTVNLAAEAILLRAGQPVRIVPVAARSHRGTWRADG